MSGYAGFRAVSCSAPQGNQNICVLQCPSKAVSVCSVAKDPWRGVGICHRTHRSGPSADTERHRRCVAEWPYGRTQKCPKPLRDTKVWRGVQPRKARRVFVSAGGGVRAFSCLPRRVTRTQDFSVLQCPAEGGFQCVQWQNPHGGERRGFTTEHTEAGVARHRNSQKVRGGWPYGRTRKNTKPLRDTKGVVGATAEYTEGMERFRVRLRRFSRLFVLAPQGNQRLQSSSVSREMRRRTACGSEGRLRSNDEVARKGPRGFQCVQWQKTLGAERKERWRSFSLEAERIPLLLLSPSVPSVYSVVVFQRLTLNSQLTTLNSHSQS